MKKRLIFIIIIAAIIALFVFFLWDIMVPLFRLQAQNNTEGAKALLLSKGAAGGVAVALVEALQMVVIFIPAEFIQITSGLSYPFYIALLLCDLGVCLGATIIFILVRGFRFKPDNSEQSEEKISRISSMAKNKRTWLLMYLLFIMPVIPFGAICYYGSSTKIGYPRYILTVATGVIPSIITSNLIGTTAKAFLMNSLPLWLLILIIILLAILLFTVLWLFLNRFFFKEGDETPDSALYYLLFKVIRFFRKHRQRLHIEKGELEGMKAPFIVLCNHASFYDFYYISELLSDYNPSYVLNHHYTINPLAARIAKRTGMITKRLFYPDMTALKIARTILAGYPVVIFPEGRLSPDGRNNPIVEDASAIYKSLKTDIVIAGVSGGYIANPKWRRRFYRTDIYVSVKDVIRKDELLSMSAEEVKARIDAGITFNESDAPRSRIKGRNRAKGLENLLYRCADCGSLYTTATKDSDLFCTACGSVHHLDESGRFTDPAGSIPAYYDRIREMEKAELDNITLTAKVHTKIFSTEKPRIRKETGVCTFTKKEFRYRSDVTEFTIDTKNLPALAFSCNKEFELYYNNEEYYFYPDENRRQVARWGLIADLIHEVENG